ncbi:MAG: DUF4389 domain-containing protein [Acidimicrobiales bacterium]
MTTFMPPAPPAPPPTSGHAVQLSIVHAQEYSRGLAALGCIFLIGRVIALIPVFIVLFVVGIAAFIASWILQFAVLFTGKYPAGGHNFVTGYLQLGQRASAFEFGLTDRYPGFSIETSGPGSASHPVQLSIVHAESYSRGLAALGCIFFIGRAITLIPVFIVLYFLRIAAFIAAWILQFAVLLTGTYPEGGHSFVTGYLRLSVRMEAWLFGLTDQYPGFSLQP